MPQTPGASARPLIAEPTKRWILIAGVVVTAAILIFAAVKSRYDLSNLDSISYMSIARQYAHGFDADAVNAYWSPLVSWLMAPLIALGVAPTLSFVFVNALGSLVGIVVGTYFVWRYSAHSFWASAVFLICAATFFVGNLPTLTPDILVVSWTIVFASTLAYLNERLDPGTVRDRVLGAVVVGALCALGYYTKLFLLPVEVLSVILWFVLRAFTQRADRRRIATADADADADAGAGPRATPAPVDRRELRRRWAVPALVILVVFAILAAPWVGILSAKYHTVTGGSSFAVNVSGKFDPDSSGTTAPTKNPLVLLPPPNNRAVSFGEDRTFQVAGTGLASKSSPVKRATHYLSQRLLGFPFYMDKLSAIAPVAVPAMALFALALVFGLTAYRRHRPAVIVAGVWAVYFIGYAGIAAPASQGGNTRYMWPLFLVSVLSSALLIPAIWRSLAAPKRKAVRVIAAILIAIVPAGSVVQHVIGMGQPFSARSSAAFGWSYLVHPAVPTAGEKLADAIERAGAIPDHSRIAGSAYRTTLRLAWYLDGQVYGDSARNFDFTNPKFQAVLKKNAIRYWVNFTPVGLPLPKFGGYSSSVKTFTATVPCADAKGAYAVPCQVSVVGLKY